MLLEENVSRQVGRYVEREGHDAVHVVDALDPGVEDATAIAPYAVETDRIVVTEDTDFLAMEPSAHADVFFLSTHAVDEFDVATAIVAVGDAVPSRSDLQNVVFLDDWLPDARR